MKINLFLLSLLILISGCSHTIYNEDFDYDLHLIYTIIGSFGAPNEKIELFGDGTYKVGRFDSDMISREGKLNKVQMEEIIREINKGFFNLSEDISNYDCFDATSINLKIEFNGKVHSVETYCDSNEVFDNIVKVLREFTSEN